MSNHRLAWYLRANRCVAYCAKVLRAAYQGFWLGLLDSRLLRDITSEFYGGSGHLASPEHNLSGLFPWESAALDRYFPPGGAILVGACGGGRELLALHQRGYQVDGFDCCGPLVESCRAFLAEHGVPGRVILSEPDRIPAEFAHYDAAIFGWGAWSHIVGRDVRLRILRAFHSRLPIDAPLLLSCVTSDTHTREARFIQSVASVGRFLVGIREPIERGDFLLSGAFWHHFTQRDIEQELIDGGFRPVDYHTDGYVAHVVGRVVS